MTVRNTHIISLQQEIFNVNFQITNKYQNSNNSQITFRFLIPPLLKGVRGIFSFFENWNLFVIYYLLFGISTYLFS